MAEILEAITRELTNEKLLLTLDDGITLVAFWRCFHDAPPIKILSLDLRDPDCLDRLNDWIEARLGEES